MSALHQPSCKYCLYLTLNLLTTTIVAPPSNGSKWQMGFNSEFKGLKNGARGGVVVKALCHKPVGRGFDS